MVVGADRMTCPYCDRDVLLKNGTRRMKNGTSRGPQQYKCSSCDKQCKEGGALHGRHVPPELIAAVLWMFYSGLSYRRTVACLCEDPHFDRVGISIQTVYKWVETYTDAAVREMGRYKPETRGHWIFDQMSVPGVKPEVKDGVTAGFWTVMDRDTRYVLASHIFGPSVQGDVTSLVEQALAVSKGQPEDVRSWKFRSSGRCYDAKSNRTIDSLIGKELPGATQVRWQVRGSRSTDRMRPEPPLRLGPLDWQKFEKLQSIETCKRFLDGLTVAHNCFTSRKEMGGRTPTPCRAAKVDVRFGSWLYVVKMGPTT